MDPDYEFKNNKHFRTRAVARLWIKPEGTGYDNRVMQLTATEMEFDKSKEAQRFIEQQRKKYSNPRGLCGARKLKMISKYDER